MKNKRFNNQPISITIIRKLSQHRNPISGHEWVEYGDITGYEVTGGGSLRTHHRTLAGAEKEAKDRAAFQKTFKKVNES